MPENRPGAASIARAMLLGLCLAGALSACSSGSGGEGGQGGDGPNPGDVVGDGGDASVAFSYPLNGQDDVYIKSQIALAYRGDVNGDPQLTLVRDGQPVDTVVERDSDQPNIFRLHVAGAANGVERARLQPNSNYGVRNGAGTTLFSFSTAGAASERFTVTRRSTIGDRRVPLTEFNPIRARFSQAVDAGSADLCLAGETLGTDCTVSVTGPNGPVSGRLLMQGANMTFDPSSNLGDGTPNSRNASDYDSSDLVAGQRYTVEFAGLRSVTGAELSDSFTVTPVAISQGSSVDTVQTLTIGAGNGDNPLNGGARNVASIASQLIGENVLDARNNADRGGLLTRLAGTTSGSRYNNLFPALLPAGQQFELDGIKLQLGGSIDMPVDSGPIQARLVSDGDVYLAGNAPLSGIDTPTRVLLRLDLGISSDVGRDNPIESLSNGVFNQTVMNVVAAGEAVPQPNGDIKLTTLGSFPVAVNGDGTATADFELELTLPNPNTGTRITVADDATPPRILAQYPSACDYVFNAVADTGETPDTSTDAVEAERPLFESGTVVGGVSGTTTISATETQCLGVRDQVKDYIAATDSMGNPILYNFDRPWANSLPLGAIPSILFSEPVDPLSLGGNISLVDGDGNDVPVRLRAEGASVVVTPVERLSPDTQYQVNVGSGVTDLAGLGVLNPRFPGAQGLSAATFTTEPMVIPTEDGEPVDLTEDLEQREVVRQTAPFLTALMPGMPCALAQDADSNFMSGGNQAGRCIGDVATQPGDYQDVTPGSIQNNSDPELYVDSPTSTKMVYNVFEQPANQPVVARFSKPVQRRTIRLADGCLTTAGNNVSDASLAIETVDDNGDCTGIVAGNLSFDNPGQALTRGFVFVPRAGFEAGRYRIVICGSAGLSGGAGSTSACRSGATIRGQNGLGLNTTPLLGTGSQIAKITQSAAETCPEGRPQTPGAAQVPCFRNDRGQGGPDILMPFDAVAATPDYISATLALPNTDTNGNGLFDNSYSFEQTQNPIAFDRLLSGLPSDQSTSIETGRYNDELGRERLQRANAVFNDVARSQNLSLPGFSINRPEIAGFFSGARPIRVRAAQTGTACPSSDQYRFGDGSGIVGTSIDRCIPVEMPPSGMLSISNIAIATIFTGRLLVRFPYALDEQGQATQRPQQGYIVPECSGTLNGESYNYAPCFVANLRLTVNGPDAIGDEAVADVRRLTIPQQDLDITVFGPVAPEQNGRLVIATINANRYTLVAYVGGSSPVPAPTLAGAQAIQLVGPAIHGGVGWLSK